MNIVIYILHAIDDIFFIFKTVKFWNFMLGCRFSFEAYAKKVSEKAAKCFLKIIEVLLDAIEHLRT